MLRKQARETLQGALILGKSNIPWVRPRQDASGDGREETVIMMMMMMMTAMTKLMRMRKMMKIKMTKRERRLISVKMR